MKLHAAVAPSALIVTASFALFFPNPSPQPMPSFGPGPHSVDRYPPENIEQLYTGDWRFWYEMAAYARKKDWKPRPWVYEASPRIHSGYGYMLWYSLDVYDTQPDYNLVLVGAIGTQQFYRFDEEIHRLGNKYPEVLSRWKEWKRANGVS